MRKVRRVRKAFVKTGLRAKVLRDKVVAQIGLPVFPRRVFRARAGPAVGSFKRKLALADCRPHLDGN